MTKQPEDYHKLAKNRGFKWLGPIVTNISAKTNWICPKGHTWPDTYYIVRHRRGVGCRVCNPSKIKTLKDYENLAKGRGFKWLSLVLPQATTRKTIWGCDEGHEWKATYQTVSSGGKCPICDPEYHKTLTKGQYEDAASEIGILHVGDLPPNQYTSTTWQCQKGHEWEATYFGVKRQGRKCPVCTNQIPYEPELFHALAKKQGIRWIGNLVVGRRKTKWQCKKGHEFSATFKGVEFGKLCPLCDRVHTLLIKRPVKKVIEALSKEYRIPESGVMNAIRDMYKQNPTQFKSLFATTMTVKRRWTAEKFQELVKFIIITKNVRSGIAYINDKTGISYGTMSRWTSTNPKSKRNMSFALMERLEFIAKQVGFYE